MSKMSQRQIKPHNSQINSHMFHIEVLKGDRVASTSYHCLLAITQQMHINTNKTYKQCQKATQQSQTNHTVITIKHRKHTGVHKKLG